jgi:four helix bundle protein
MAIRSYEDLVVWQISMMLVSEIYKATKLFPRDEQFGLVNQLRRAAVSIPSNIAEGNGRLHKVDFIRCLSIARGSLMEVKTQFEIAYRLSYITDAERNPLLALSNEVGRLLNGLIKSLDADKSFNRILEETEPYDPTP